MAACKDDNFVTVEVTDVVLDYTELDMRVGETRSLSARVEPESAADKTVVWSSDDETVATVSDGLVRAVAPGATVVSAMAGGLKASCAVTVRPVEVTDVVLDYTELDMRVGETRSLSARVEPESAADKTVVWSSDDETVAAVSDGLVRAVAPGAARITARAGECEGVCFVVVEDTVPSEWSVGDYYNLNGVEGIVFRVSADGASGKVVSLDESLKYWAVDASVKTFANREDDGKYNTSTVCGMYDYPANYPAFEWCVSKGEGWYMPAVDELLEVYGNKDLIDAAMKAHGGEPLPSTCWSSTESFEYPDENAFYVTYTESTGRASSMGDSKDYEDNVRAVFAF